MCGEVAIGSNGAGELDSSDDVESFDGIRTKGTSRVIADSNVGRARGLRDADDGSEVTCLLLLKRPLIDDLMFFLAADLPKMRSVSGLQSTTRRRQRSSPSITQRQSTMGNAEELADKRP